MDRSRDRRHYARAVHAERVPTEDKALSASEYIRGRRIQARMTVQSLAARAGVSVDWLEAFEAGWGAEELTYDRLLTLVRATEPPRPEWWDEGHEHDLHLGSSAAAVGAGGSSDYWARIQAVRTANRSVGRPR